MDCTGYNGADFLANIMFRFETMTRPYGITADNFRPAFEGCAEELGIVLG